MLMHQDVGDLPPRFNRFLQVKQWKKTQFATEINQAFYLFVQFEPSVVPFAIHVLQPEVPDLA